MSLNYLFSKIIQSGTWIYGICLKVNTIFPKFLATSVPTPFKIHGDNKLNKGV